MNRKLKAFGLVLVAVFAMSALSAATASAELFHAGEHGTVIGENVGEEVFTTNAGTVKCKTAKYTGTSTTNTPGSQIVTPQYSSCTAFGFVNTTIDVGTCQYRFNTPVNTTSTVDIINCGANGVVVTAFNCEVTIPNQSGLSHVVWENVAGTSPHHIRANVTISGITYIQHSKSFPGCNTAGTNGTPTSLFHDGTYHGTNTVKAFNTKGVQVPLTVT
jgi:hypothetical protein